MILDRYATARGVDFVKQLFYTKKTPISAGDAMGQNVATAMARGGFLQLASTTCKYLAYVFL